MVRDFCFERAGSESRSGVGAAAEATKQQPTQPGRRKLWVLGSTERARRSPERESGHEFYARGEPFTSVRRRSRPRWVARAVFRAGMSGRVVDAKWPGFRADFHNFDPATVAAMDEAELAKVESDPQVIRNVRKLEAIVENGRAMQDLLADDGGARSYLSSSTRSLSRKA